MRHYFSDDINMMQNISKKLTALFSIILLSACNSTAEPTLKWISYKDITTETQSLAFTQYPQVQYNEKQGELLQRNNKTTEEYRQLADIYMIEVGNNQYIRIALLDQNGYAINPYQANELAQLAQSNGFELYQFGRGQISHSQFQATQSLCHSFASKQGINIKASNNYYATPEQFITSLIHATLQQSKPPIQLEQHTEFNIDDPILLAKVKKDEKQYAQQNAQAFLIQQQRFLVDVVCGRGYSL